MTVKGGRVLSESPVFIDVRKGLKLALKVSMRTGEYVDNSTSRVLQIICEALVFFVNT